MGQGLRVLTVAAVVLIGAAGASAASGSQPASALREDYVPVPMPPGFTVQATELEGPVFADPQGKTLYVWPYDQLRNGATGDPKNTSACTDQVTTVTAGLMSPYPPGLALPEVDKRRSCAAEWPAVLAADDAKPVGRWTIFTRKDGRKQWAYAEHALYTSALDHAAGDTMGGSNRTMDLGNQKGSGDAPAVHRPVGPPSALPPGFTVVTAALGRLLVTEKCIAVYSFDKDTPNKSSCDAACTRMWSPILAPATAQAKGSWTIFERAPGVRQWAFRSRPLYIDATDTRLFSLTGNDVPGWHAVYTQQAPTLPADFVTQDTEAGVVLADRGGKTIYVYNCGDDSLDQLACDHPDAPQAYRLAVCGGGSAAKCIKTFPYVPARPGSRSSSRTWSVMTIDPLTGHRAAAGAPGALQVWAYRDRPVYTYVGDLRPGDINGHDRGEFAGKRNGFQAFILRDEFFTER
jgi:predicted lipoprotein with Yx(FWY)xxD motif